MLHARCPCRGLIPGRPHRRPRGRPQGQRRLPSWRFCSLPPPPGAASTVAWQPGERRP